jgi:hypothetical protein
MRNNAQVGSVQNEFSPWCSNRVTLLPAPSHKKSPLSTSNSSARGTCSASNDNCTFTSTFFTPLSIPNSSFQSSVHIFFEVGSIKYCRLLDTTHFFNPIVATDMYNLEKV